MQGGQGIMNKYRMSTSSEEEGDSGDENDGDWELDGVRKANRKAVHKSTGQQHSGGGFLDTLASFFPFVCGGGTATTSPKEKRRKSRMRH